MAKLIDYQLVNNISANTQLMGLVVNGSNFETVRVSRNALGNYVQSLIDASAGTGEPGKDGREIELRNDGTNIVWRYVGDPAWIILVSLASLKGDKGEPGNPGTPGTPGTPGANGKDGDPGKSATVTVGTVSTGQPGSPVSVTNSGTASDAILNFTIPRGAVGETGDSATVAVGTTTTGTAGTNASVTNVGTANDAILNFTIPRGAQGIQGNPGTNGVDGKDGKDGDPGLQGDPGAAATIALGTVSTGAPGSNAQVINTGTNNAAVFNFTIPRGDAGAKGDNGTGATVSVGTVTTGAAGSNATITNSGTNTQAVFDFTIPRGDKGTDGNAADISNLTHAAASKATPVDADEIPLIDSASTWTLKKLTWANIKAALTSAFLPRTGGDIDGNINLTGNSRKIAADFSNSTLGNRTIFQTNVTNGVTGLYVAPNGTSQISGVSVTSSSDIANSSIGGITQFNTDFRISSSASGSGTYVPMTFYTNGIERMRIATDGSFAFAGNVSVTGNARRIVGDMSNTTLGDRVTLQTSTPNALSILGIMPSGIGTISGYRTHGGNDPANASVGDLVILGGSEVRLNSGAVGTGSYLPMTFYTNGVERMRISVDGKVGIGAGQLVMPFTASNVNMTGGAPLTTGSGTDPNASTRLQGGSVAMDFGTYQSGEAWIQARLFNNYASNMPIRMNPNGGAVNFGPDGFGFATGSGGTVTQPTSKNTNITINKVSGRIVTHNSSLAVNTTAAFIIYNDKVTVNDVVLITGVLTSDADPGNYRISVLWVNTGAISVSITNVGASTLAQAVSFNFAIIKGATV